MLRHEGVRQAQLSIVFVTDRKIRLLNKKFLNRDHPTDILAFDLSNQSTCRSRSPRQSRLGRIPPTAGRRGQSKHSRQKKIDGEIVISTVTAHKNARRFKTSPQREVILYVAHGILHLLGFDDHSPKDRNKMKRKEEELMELIYDS